LFFAHLFGELNISLAVSDFDKLLHTDEKKYFKKNAEKFGQFPNRYYLCTALRNTTAFR